MALHASDLGDVVPAVLATHIATGGFAILAGIGALVFRKGGHAHITSGKLFVVAMLIMASTAAYIAWRIQTVTLAGALLTIYLVTTAWLTARQPSGKLGAAGLTALGLMLIPTSVDLWFGWKAMHAPGGELFGYPPGPYLISGAIGVLAASLDVKVLIAGGVVGAARIARHLWRMCLALFIALSSFATQGLRHILPPELKGTAIHWALVLGPGLIVIVLMFVWLIRVRFGRLAKALPIRDAA